MTCKWYLSKFLCFQLETGGVVVGWFSIVLNTLLIIDLIILMTCGHSYLIGNINVGHTSASKSELYMALFKFAMLLTFLLFIVYSCTFLKGVQQRATSPFNEMKGCLYFYTTFTVAEVLQLYFDDHLVGTIAALILLTFLIYSIVTVYSLCEKFSHEHRGPLIESA